MISTLKMAKRFIDAGTPKSQAEVFAEALKEIEERHLDNVASKNDLLTVKTDIKEYIKLCTILISLGIGALAFLMAYLKAN
jgi:hypothetical protein